MSVMYRVRAASVGWTGGPGLNTFYFDAGADAAEADSDAALLCVNRVRDAFQSGTAIYPPAWNMTVNPSVDVLDAVDGALVSNYNVAAPATIVGTGAPGFGPIATMLMLRLRTPTISNGQRVNGRAFLGPVTLGVDAAGTPDAGIIALALAIGNELLDVGIGGGPALQVWSRPKKAVVGPPAVPARDGQAVDVFSVTVPDYYAILRSRRD